MSRVGKAPVPIPDKTKVEISGSHITVTGPKGTLERDIHPEMSAAVEDNQVLVTRPSDQKRHRSLHGLTRALIANMVSHDNSPSTGHTRREVLSRTTASTFPTPVAMATCRIPRQNGGQDRGQGCFVTSLMRLGLSSHTC